MLRALCSHSTTYTEAAGILGEADTVIGDLRLLGEPLPSWCMAEALFHNCVCPSIKQGGAGEMAPSVKYF